MHVHTRRNRHTKRYMDAYKDRFEQTGRRTYRHKYQQRRSHVVTELWRESFYVSLLPDVFTNV